MLDGLREKYVNLLTDFGFKRVFGTEANKATLIAFLNSLLPEAHQIADLSFKNPEHLGKTEADRKAIFDLYCQNSQGEYFIVELQKAHQKFFKDRSVYYSTFPIQEQADRGEWDYQLSPVYFVGILNFVFDEDRDNPNYLHTVQLRDQACQVFYDKLQFIYLELPKFQKSLEGLESPLEQWAFLFRHLPDLPDRPPSLQSPVFDQLFETARIATFSQEERRSYHDSLKVYRDLSNILQTSAQTSEDQGWAAGRAKGLEEGRDAGRAEGLEEGREAGRAEGLEEGRTEAMMAVAQRMKAMGMAQEEVARCTGLSIEAIEAL